MARFLCLVLVSGALHGGALLAHFLSYQPPQAPLHAGDIAVEFLPSPASIAAPKRVAAADSPANALDEPLRPVPVFVEQPDHPLVLAAPPPLTRPWQPDFPAWKRSVSERPVEMMPPRPESARPERNPAVALQPRRESAAVRDPRPRLASKPAPPVHTQAKPAPNPPLTAAKKGMQASPGSAAALPSVAKTQGVRTEARLLGGDATPPYPIEARRRGLEGNVEVVFRVTETGEVVKAQLYRSSGHRILDETALQFLRTLRFVPARQGGVAVPSEAYWRWKYRLE